MSKFDYSNALIRKAFSIASKEEYTPHSIFKDEISFVLFSNHLTYKYVLVNALLAKAAMPEINPLCLQKKSELPGAYDARSHCHKVIVPFERTFLNGALGNSNEPFLNKPARFKELSKENAVRRGKDQQLLNTLCDTLPKIDNPELAFSTLTDSIYYCIKLAEENSSKLSFNYNTVSTNEISNFLYQILEESHGGEILSIVVGSLMKAFVENIKGNNSVQVHKINQSGASSKEISDIDVYHNNSILYTIEAKDKTFNEYDVEHAVSKSASSGAKKLLFIIGPRGAYEGISKNPNQLIKDANSQGIQLNLIGYRAFIEQMLLLIIWNENNQNFIKFVHEIFTEAQIKSETVTYVLENASTYKLTD